MKATKPPAPSKEGDDADETSSKTIVVPDAPVVRRQRTSGEQVLVPCERSDIAPPSLKILLTGDSIICQRQRVPGGYDKLSLKARTVDRYSGALALVPSALIEPPASVVELQAAAVLGIINLSSERFLAVASECVCVAVLGSIRIYGLTRVELLPFAIQPSVSDKSLVPEIASMALGIERFLSAQGFFFAEGADLTRPLAATAAAMAAGPPSPLSLMEAADDRFFWNREMCLEMTLLEGHESGANGWVVPIVHGTVHCDTLPLTKDAASRLRTSAQGGINLAVISRRSRLRAFPRDVRCALTWPRTHTHARTNVGLC